MARGLSLRRLLPTQRADLVCQQVVELVTDYLEGALPRAERRRFERHLAACPNCTEYLAQMRATIALAGRITPADLTPRMRAEFAELYRRWQADSDRNQPGGAAAQED